MKVTFEIDRETYAHKWLVWRMRNGVVGMYGDLPISLRDKNVVAFLNELLPNVTQIWWDKDSQTIKMKV
jgi:hypothetical protein